MIRKMGKKAMSQEMVHWLLKLTFAIGGALAVVFLINYAFAVTVETRELRAELFLQRLLSSPTGMVYVDELGVVWPGTIDLRKFSQQHIEASAVPNAHDWIAAELELNGKIIHYNKEKYVQWQYLVAGGTGALYQKELFVLVTDGKSTESGRLRITMITPKE